MPAAHFAKIGFILLQDVLTGEQAAELVEFCSVSQEGRAGDREVLAEEWCRSLAAQLRSLLVAQSLMPEDYVAIQCILFEKSASRNWLVGLHQDLSVPVLPECVDLSWSGYSLKAGGTFVHASESLLANRVAVRVHLDRCEDDDGPLCVVPGSHGLGRLNVAQSLSIRERNGLVRCLADIGDVLVMRPTLLHSSSKSRGSSRRRVLHFLFAPKFNSDGLIWNFAV